MQAKDSARNGGKPRLLTRWQAGAADFASDDIRRRVEWSRLRIEAANGPIPRFGSAAWHRLDDTSPIKVAGVVVFAELYANYLDTLEERLRAEIAANRAEMLRAADESFAEMAAEVRRLASSPSFAELADRRGEPDRAERARRYGRAMRDGWQR